MKICICSDSHGSAGTLDMIVKKERPDALFFLGDGERDAAALTLPEGMLFAAVRGNRDFSGIYPEERLLTLEGKRLLLTHGHLFRVKQGLAMLQQRAEEARADITVYGHTHAANARILEGRLYLNPGAVGGYRSSYSVLTLNGEEARYSFHRV